MLSEDDNLTLGIHSSHNRSGCNGALRWSSFLGKQKHHVQRPTYNMRPLAPRGMTMTMNQCRGVARGGPGVPVTPPW